MEEWLMIITQPVEFFCLTFGYALMISGKTFQYVQSSKPYLVMWCWSRHWNDEVCKICITGKLEWSTMISGVKEIIGDLQQDLVFSLWGWNNQECDHLSKYFSLTNQCGQSLSLHICIAAIRINQVGVSFTHVIECWITVEDICAVVLNHDVTQLGTSSQMNSNHAEHMPLQEQMTTITLIIALFRPLPQSSKHFSEDTWVSLTHCQDYSTHIVAILQSSFWFGPWQQWQYLAFKSCLTPSILWVETWNHHQRSLCII